ncbi:ABC transporter permease [candidate division WOR-3 bacterium]|uniref:FtsX-like permease family protein n=1 Tax=candidate division WOR-3 bacterium TaxID=2052148 RepID=A0A7C5HJB1_UNCW3|nr:ABC transporter permease [candidate division WOR-3 bacterium]HHE04649.1 FtsX-like permease family protein [candidate division WOR-3 bacterium]
MVRGFLTEVLRSAAESIRTNKLRAILTTLGIIIGVTTVIAVISVIAGIQNKVTSSFSSLGSNVIYVQKFPWVMGRRMQWWKLRKRKDITLDDYKAIKEFATSISFVAPEMHTRYTLKRKDKKVEDVTITGTSYELPKINQQDVEYGRFLSADDINYRKNVCVLGKDVVDNLFPNTEPIGQYIRISGSRFLIIGVLEQKGQMLGQSMDNIAIIPYTTYEKIYGTRRSITIAILADDRESATEEVRWILRNKRHLKENQEDDFAINSSDALIKSWNQLTRSIFLVMIAIASVALIVGGIGIMNIMLVSVTERTREIGIRKAIGAKKKEILMQFLVESVIVSLLGGIIGIVFGFGIAKVVSVFANIPFAMPVWGILIGFFFSFIVGVFFGYYPARKASMLNPVEALRYE